MFKKILTSALILLFANTVFAQNNYEAGKDYEVLSVPVLTADKSKVEVVEVFWYGCIHCFNFEPMLAAWKGKTDNDITFNQMPAVWNKVMKLHARAFYTARALNVAAEVDKAIFQALNVDRKRLSSVSSIRDIFVANGISAETFDKTIGSFGINAQVQLAESRVRSYRIQGTPEMVVNGKYRVSASMAGSQKAMLAVVDFLVAKEKANLSKAN